MGSVMRPSGPQLGNADTYIEERVPFDSVLLKLVTTKPPHKTVKPAPAKPSPAKG